MYKEKKIDADLLESIGRTIKEIRIEKKITQTVLAQMVEQSSNYVSRVESGYFNLSISILSNYIEALDMNFPDFFQRVEKNKKKDE